MFINITGKDFRSAIGTTKDAQIVAGFAISGIGDATNVWLTRAGNVRSIDKARNKQPLHLPVVIFTILS